MTRAVNPTGASLLDRSTAKPGNVDMAIFAKKSGSSGSHGVAGGGSTNQGTVNSNYLAECRADNPGTAPQDSNATSVSLGKCSIDTPAEELALSQPFEMSVEIKAAEGQSSGSVSFRLYCCQTKSDGTEVLQDQSAVCTGKANNGKAVASGTLLPPKEPVPSGTKLKYFVVAEHPLAKEKSESQRIEVDASKVPQPLAARILDASNFGFGGFFVLPAAAKPIAEFYEACAKNKGAAVAIFGHGPKGAETESGRRAYAVHCLLTKDPSGWMDLSKSAKPGQWDERATRTMLAALQSKSGSPYFSGPISGPKDKVTESAIKEFQRDNNLKADGVAGPSTSARLVRLYMDKLSQPTLANEDFVGDPKDGKRQWACTGCGASNPVRVTTDSNTDGGRATLFLFPESAKGPGKIEFPCPSWTDGSAKCKKQFFEDADKRTTPAATERTWEKDKDTFACKFYAEIAAAYPGVKQPDAVAISTGESTKDLTPLPIYDHHFHENHFFPNFDSDEFLGVLAGLVEYHKKEGACPLGIHPDLPAEERDIHQQRLRVAECIIHGDEEGWSEVTKETNGKDLQSTLKFFSKKGWPCDPGKVDGEIGHKTQNAVYQFQHSCKNLWGLKLSTDGICGPKTWNAILYTLGILVGARPLPEIRRS